MYFSEIRRNKFYPRRTKSAEHRENFFTFLRNAWAFDAPIFTKRATVQLGEPLCQISAKSVKKCEQYDYV